MIVYYERLDMVEADMVPQEWQITFGSDIFSEESIEKFIQTGKIYRLRGKMFLVVLEDIPQDQRLELERAIIGNIARFLFISEIEQKGELTNILKGLVNVLKNERPEVKILKEKLISRWIDNDKMFNKEIIEINIGCGMEESFDQQDTRAENANVKKDEIEEFDEFGERSLYGQFGLFYKLDIKERILREREETLISANIQINNAQLMVNNFIQKLFEQWSGQIYRSFSKMTREPRYLVMPEIIDHAGKEIFLGNPDVRE